MYIKYTDFLVVYSRTDISMNKEKTCWQRKNKRK